MEDFPTERLETRVVFEEICQFGHVTSVHLGVASHKELEDILHFCRKVVDNNETKMIINE